MSDTHLGQLSWIDPLADRFERDWKEGRRPQLEEYLGAAPGGHRGDLLRELLPVEVYHRQRLGEAPTAAEYRARLPEDESAVQAVFRGAPTVAGLAIPAAGPGDLPEDHWGRYTLSRLHGEGGLGQVWVAQDTALDREVALKTLHPQHTADPGAQRRFLREAQLAGQLEHPNIVPVYELSKHPEGGQLYYTMRFVRGRTLREAIREYHSRRREGAADPLALPRLLMAFVSVCHAMSFAHDRGVIHRDLKPDNVMLGGFGEVIVLDWGLARVVEGPRSKPPGGEAPEVASDRTAQGSVLGTPAYMAPEQAQGSIDRIDQRTDVYGLGAILFEVLTGHPPHEGEYNAAMLRRIAEGEAPRARDVEPATPPALDAVCAKAMALGPYDRYARAADVAADVERYLADEPVSAYREVWGQRVGRWARHHRTATVAVAAALAGVVLATSIAAVRQSRLADQEHQARLAAERAQEQGIRVSARFASRTVSQEIALRWSVLGKASGDPQLPLLIKGLEAAERPRAKPEWQELQAWLKRQYASHSGAAGTTSWFLTDARGRHLGRYPPADRLVGRNLGHRDYFHGGGQDLPPQTVGLRPIRDAHCSIVYESQAVRKYLVAFSTPVWSGGRDTSQGEVIGVLSMTVEVGHFGALQVNLGEEQVAALVDTRNDWVEGTPRKGLVLHHPRLVELRAEEGLPDGPAVFRVGADKVALFERLRTGAREHEGRRAKLSWEEQLAAPRREVAESLDLGYRDPVGGAYGGPWLAAFEPILVKRPDDSVKDIGWVVIVQERRGRLARPQR